MFFNPDNNVDPPLVEPLAGPVDLRVLQTGRAQRAAAVAALVGFVRYYLEFP